MDYQRLKENLILGFSKIFSYAVNILLISILVSIVVGGLYLVYLSILSK